MKGWSVFGSSHRRDRVRVASISEGMNRGLRLIGRRRCGRGISCGNARGDDRNIEVASLSRSRVCRGRSRRLRNGLRADVPTSARWHVDSVELLLSQGVDFLFDGFKTLIGREWATHRSNGRHCLNGSEVQGNILRVVDRVIVGRDGIGELLVPVHDALAHVASWH